MLAFLTDEDDLHTNEYDDLVTNTSLDTIEMTSSSGKIEKGPSPLTSSDSKLSMTSESEGIPSTYEHSCGYGRMQPKCLQKCNNPKCLLFVICWFVFVQSEYTLI